MMSLFRFVRGSFGFILKKRLGLIASSYMSYVYHALTEFNQWCELLKRIMSTDAYQCVAM